MKQNIIRRLLYLTFALMFVICAFQISGGVSALEVVNTPATNAKVETWVEQNFWDVFWGTGWWQTRTVYTIRPHSPYTVTTYENRKLLLSTTNNTNEAQTASYSYTSKIGHNFNATIGAKKSHFEVAIGYTLNAETSTTYTANANVPGKTSISVWGSDVRVKSHYTTYITQVQRASLNGWVDHGEPESDLPLIKEYNGKHIEWSYS